MEKRAVVLGVTSNLAFAAGTLLASILARDPGFDADVVIFQDGMSDDQKATFLTLWPRCHFRGFTAADAEARLGVPLSHPKVAGTVERVTHMVLSKLELPDLLTDYTKVVWLDTDLLVRGPLDALWAFDCLAWRPLREAAFVRRAKVLAAYPEGSLDPAVPLLNGGVIGVAQGFLAEGGYREGLHEIARDLISRAPRTQLVDMTWYLIAALRRMPVTSYPLRLNHLVTQPVAGGATIVHAAGPHKFWNATPLRQLYPDWLQHQGTWVAAGGTPYDGRIHLGEVHAEDPAQVLQAAEMRAFWEVAFRRLRLFLPPGFQVDLQHDRPFLTVYLPGRPESEHLHLVRMPSAERLGIRIHLPEAQAKSALAALAKAVPDLHEHGEELRSVYITQIRTALYTLAAALA